MKDLNKYLDNMDDIDNVTKKLAGQSAKFARFVIKHMWKAGIKSLLGGRLQYREGYYRTSGGLEDDKLFLDTGDYHSENGDAGDLSSTNCRQNDGAYMCDDFSCWVQYPTREEVMLFNELAPEILKELASYGEEQPNNFIIPESDPE